MPQKVAITDANIFIDLFDTDLISDFFELPFQFVTLVEVVGQEIRPDQYELLKPFIEKGRLVVEEEAEIDEDLKFKNAFSSVDKALLSFAYHHKILLLSGEREMRSWCLKRNLEYHGILWIFDLLVEQEQLSSIQAIDRLKILISKNTRLPINECYSRIRIWERKN